MCVVEPGAAVRRAQLQGRIFQRRQDRPPQMAGVLDGAGAHHGRDVFVVVAVAAEQFRQPGARQLVVGGEPVAFEPGGAALPEWRRGRQRDEQRQIRQHPRHHVNPARRIGKLDMDVHAARPIALADHLQHVHDMSVAVLGWRFIDYVVTKIPRFAFEKFRGASALLSTSMKSVAKSWQSAEISRKVSEGFARP